jgi:Flp pilus assembly protein TadG
MLYISTVPRKIKREIQLRLGNQKGQSIIIFAFIFIGLIAMLGLALDLGLVYIERTRIKRAVDAATLAGVVELPNEEKAILRAIGYLDQNGYRLRDNAGNAQVNVWVRGCAHAGYLQNTTVFTNYHNTNPNPAPRQTITRTETITNITVNKIYHLYFPPNGNKVEDPRAEFFIDTRTFQSRDINGNFETDNLQCNEASNILGTASKVHLDGIVPVDMNFMQFFGFPEVPVWDEAIAQNVTNLDVAIVFDMSGSMQFDTACYGCYDPYEWAANNDANWFDPPPPLPPSDPDFSIDYPNPAYIHRIPTDHLPSTSFQAGGTAGVGANQGKLCWGRDNPANDVEYRTISGAGDTRRYMVIEAELYSQNTSRLYGPLRMPDSGYWAVQHTNLRTVLDMMSPPGPYLVGATPILTYTRGSWVSHNPYIRWAIDNVQPFGHDYTLDEIKNDPNGKPRLEYDFITASDWDCSSTPNTCSGSSTGNDDTRIWGRVQGGGSWGTGRQSIYWAVYDYNSLYAPAVGGDVTQVTPLGSGKIEEIRETVTNEGPNYGGAANNRWQWRELTGSSTALNLINGARYTLIIWPGRVGYDIDQIVIENDDSTAFTSNYNGGGTTLQATRGSAFRLACNRCNPIYGLTITQTTDCDPPSDNGAYDPFIFVNGNDLSDPAVNPLYSGYQPIRNAKEAVKHFIERLQPQFDQAGIVSYSTDTPAEGRMELRCLKRYSAQQCFQSTNPISYTEVLRTVEMLPPDGSTNMAQGMLRGLEMLGINANNVNIATWNASNDCSTATDHCGRGGSARRVMIIMSDGVANRNPWDTWEGGQRVAAQNCHANNLYLPDIGDTSQGANSEDWAKDCVRYYAQIAADNNVTMYTIGLGNGVDDTLMTTVAELPGSNGEFFKAVSSAELDGIFSTILESITVRLIE